MADSIKSSGRWSCSSRQS